MAVADDWSTFSFATFFCYPDLALMVMGQEEPMMTVVPITSSLRTE